MFLAEDVLEAIKPEEVGSSVRFNFSAKSGAKLNFPFSRDSDGLWTPSEIPFSQPRCWTSIVAPSGSNAKR